MKRKIMVSICIAAMSVCLMSGCGSEDKNPNTQNAYLDDDMAVSFSSETEESTAQPEIDKDVISEMNGSETDLF